MKEQINHPEHYNKGKFEVIEVIADQGWEEGFCRGDALKYICRAGEKDPDKIIEDLKKGAWYINWLVEYKQRKVNKK